LVLGYRWTTSVSCGSMDSTSRRMPDLSESNRTSLCNSMLTSAFVPDHHRLPRFFDTLYWKRRVHARRHQLTARVVRRRLRGLLRFIFPPSAMRCVMACFRALHEANPGARRPLIRVRLDSC
jgi:hypothetical protein